MNISPDFQTVTINGETFLFTDICTKRDTDEPPEVLALLQKGYSIAYVPMIDADGTAAYDIYRSEFTQLQKRKQND